MGASKAGETKPIGAPPGDLRIFTQKSPRKMRDAFCFFSFPKTWLSCFHDFWGSKDRKTPFNYYQYQLIWQMYDIPFFTTGYRSQLVLCRFLYPINRSRYAKGTSWFMTGSFQWTVIVSTYFTNTYIHYTTLHYTTLHYITLHYITLHYTTLHYTTLHYIHTYMSYHTIKCIHHITI